MKYKDIVRLIHSLDVPFTIHSDNGLYIKVYTDKLNPTVKITFTEDEMLDKMVPLV